MATEEDARTVAEIVAEGSVASDAPISHPIEMPIPTEIDRRISEIDDLHHLILTRLRSFHLGSTSDPRGRNHPGTKAFGYRRWHAQLVAAFGTTSATVAYVEVERIAKALRRDGKIDPAEIDTVIAIVSGQRPKDELEAMIVCQMAVTHALTMRSFGNLNRSSSIQRQDSNALTVSR
jgi:hypothetical protein